MNNSLYIIAGLMVLLWGIVTFGFHSFRAIDILLPVAAFIILLRILFGKQLSKNNKYEKTKN